MLLRRLGFKFWITFSLALVIAEGGEVLFHKFASADDGQASYADSLVVASGVYQRLVTAPRHPVVRYTALVEINPELDVPSVSALNVCSQRAFLAHLITQLSKAGPEMIVIDKYFGSQSCGADDTGTRELVAAVQAARMKHPVVVGINTKPVGTDSSSKLTAQNFVDEGLDFGPVEGPAQEGVVNVARDTRQLPLQWSVYADRDSIGNSTPVELDTLALAVAKLARPQLLQENSTLEDLIVAGKKPFIGFLPEHAFIGHRIFASEVVCGRRLGVSEDWRKCVGELPPPRQLRCRIVVIGESSPHLDQHRSIVGRVAGFYLQANYIEALIDDRFYAPAGWVSDVAFSLIFLVALELILIVFHGMVVRQILLIFGLLGLSCMALYLIIVHAGIYIDPILITGLAVVVKALHLLYGWAQRAAHDSSGA